MAPKSVFVEGIFTLRNLRSASAAAIIEILIASGIAAALIWQRVHPGETPKPPPIQVLEDPMPSPLRPTTPVPEEPQIPHLSEVPAIPTDIPTSNTLPVQAPLPPQVGEQSSQPPASLMADFSTRMLRAINAQKAYPKVSLLKGETGETTVSFDYVDGVVSSVRVDRSSGVRELDQAAVEAVQKAALPAKPSELAGLRHFVFTLAFDIGN